MNIKNTFNDGVRLDNSLNRSTDYYNRAKSFSEKDVESKDFYIGIKDIDESILYHINMNIRPVVVQNGDLIIVPVIFSYPERQYSVQNNNVSREDSGRIIAPVISVNRGSVTPVMNNVPFKVDGNNPKNFFIFKELINNKNRFEKLKNTKNIRNYFRLVVVPEYIDINYSISIFTNYVEQANHLVEMFKYASHSFWGDSNKFLFFTFVNNIQTDVNYSNSDERIVRSRIGITVKGYILPNTFNRDISYEKIISSKNKVKFDIKLEND
ncbi:MAG: hypothetical protein IRZ03_15725 [Acidobacterium ailaaui]|nr:hypothetical protein [Pseudacidobacterium ailaaui]